MVAEPQTVWFDSNPLPWIIRRNRNLKGQDECQIGVYIYIYISFVGLHNQSFKWFGPQVSVLSGHPPQHGIESFCLEKTSKIIKSIHLSIAARFPHNILPTVAVFVRIHSNSLWADPAYNAFSTDRRMFLQGVVAAHTGCCLTLCTHIFESCSAKQNAIKRSRKRERRSEFHTSSNHFPWELPQNHWNFQVWGHENNSMRTAVWCATLRRKNMKLWDSSRFFPQC